MKEQASAPAFMLGTNRFLISFTEKAPLTRLDSRLNYLLISWFTPNLPVSTLPTVYLLDGGMENYDHIYDFLYSGIYPISFTKRKTSTDEENQEFQGLIKKKKICYHLLGFIGV